MLNAGRACPGRPGWPSEDRDTQRARPPLTWHASRKTRQARRKLPRSLGRGSDGFADIGGLCLETRSLCFARLCSAAPKAPLPSLLPWVTERWARKAANLSLLKPGASGAPEARNSQSGPCEITSVDPAIPQTACGNPGIASRPGVLAGGLMGFFLSSGAGHPALASVTRMHHF